MEHSQGLIIYWGTKLTSANFKGIEIISSIFSDHSDVKLVIKHRKRNEKKTDDMETKQHATKKTNGVNKEFKRES